MIYIGEDNGLLPQRKKMISASRLGALWPVSDAYKSRRACIQEMLGIRKDVPNAFCLYARNYGITQEPKINEVYMKWLNVHVNRACRGLKHPKYNLWGTPDGLVIDNKNKEIRLVEYKARLLQHRLPDTLKLQYYLQVQCMMYIIQGIMEAKLSWADYTLLPSHLFYYHEKEGGKLWEVKKDSTVFNIMPHKIQIIESFIENPDSIPKSKFDILDVESHVNVFTCYL